jgi:predicted RNA-binding protein YlxR (DUF448 family)
VPRDRAELELIRLVLVPAESTDSSYRALVDLGGSTIGRGAWVHARPACLSNAAKRGLARSLRAPVKTTAADLAEQLRAAATRRAQSLLASALRARKAAVGSQAVAAAEREGSVRLLVVARDAGAAAHRPWVSRALEAGKALAWGDKQSLAQALGRPRPVAVIAILDDGLGDAFQHAAALSECAAK